MSAQRFDDLVAAVHRGCEGLDSTAAQHILAAVVPVLRKQIAEDLLAFPAWEWALAGEDAGSIAATIARGAR